jgi:predicted choloylglycine hydrolase
MLNHHIIRGSHLEVGKALGRLGAAAVHGHLIHSSAWRAVMALKHHPALPAMAAQVQAQCPAIWQEIQGLAQGLGMDAADVFAWQCRGDLWAMAPEGCTTLQLPGDPGHRVAHNEDGDPGLASACALVSCAIDGQARFSSFIYPGSIPGHSFAVNDAGLVLTVNNLRCLGAAAGLPRMVLARAVLAQRHLHAAVALIQHSPRSGGFHFTLGQRGERTLYSVEFNSRACSVLALTQPAVHANHMVHPAMAQQAQIVTASSAQRQQRGEACLSQLQGLKSALQPLDVLFDQDHPQFPIYRKAPDDSDGENTIATADLHIGAHEVRWAVHSGQNPVPDHCFKDDALC